MKYAGSTIKPTPRSDIARPKKRTFEGECNDGVLHIEASIRKFPTAADTEVRQSTMLFKMNTPAVALASKCSRPTKQQQWKSSIVGDAMVKPSFSQLLLLIAVDVFRKAVVIFPSRYYCCTGSFFELGRASELTVLLADDETFLRQQGQQEESCNIITQDSSYLHGSFYLFRTVCFGDCVTGGYFMS